MGLVNVTELLEDPDFAESFTLIRITGKWINHRFVTDDPQEIPFFGPVQPPNVKDMEVLPEGERLKGIMCFWVKDKDVYQTRDISADGPGGISDIFLWRGNHYKIIQIAPWSDFGWVKAFGVRMEGK